MESNFDWALDYFDVMAAINTTRRFNDLVNGA